MLRGKLVRNRTFKSMDYFREFFFTMFIFMIGYSIFKYGLFKKLAKSGTIEKDFKGCYILKYPNRVEFHNKNEMYLIDVDEFFELNPKLKGKIKIIERPLIDICNSEAVQKEIEFRKEIREENNNI